MSCARCSRSPRTRRSGSRPRCPRAGSSWPKGDRLVGCLQLVDDEVTIVAVAEDRQGSGIGQALMERAVAECRAAGRRRVVVATGAADVDLLRFYQRLGFRFARVERDTFMPAGGYPPGLEVDGIPLPRPRLARPRSRRGRHGDRGASGSPATRIASTRSCASTATGSAWTRSEAFAEHEGYAGVFLGTARHGCAPRVHERRRPPRAVAPPGVPARAVPGRSGLSGRGGRAGVGVVDPGRPGQPVLGRARPDRGGSRRLPRRAGPELRSGPARCRR